jgi:hypothetical protein
MYQPEQPLKPIFVGGVAWLYCADAQASAMLFGEQHFGGLALPSKQTPFPAQEPQLTVPPQPSGALPHGQMTLTPFIVELHASSAVFGVQLLAWHDEPDVPYMHALGEVQAEVDASGQGIVQPHPSAIGPHLAENCPIEHEPSGTGLHALADASVAYLEFAYPIDLHPAAGGGVL